MRACHMLTLVVMSVSLAAAGDADVLWCVGGKAGAVFRFSIRNGGTAAETWAETAPALAVSDLKVGAYMPAHGYYYLGRSGDGKVQRYTKDGVAKLVGQFESGAQSFVISPDQAYVYGADFEGSAEHNCIRRMRIADGVVEDYITTGVNQVRNMAFGSDGLLYVGSRGNKATNYSGGVNPLNAYAGVQSFDVSGPVPILKKHYWTSGGNAGGLIVDSGRSGVYVPTANKTFLFGMVDDRIDAEKQTVYRESVETSSDNAFAASLIDGRPYSANYHATGAEVVRYNEDGTKTVVATISSDSASGKSGNLSQVASILEDGFPEVDSTLNIIKLSDYWSFNRAAAGGISLSSCVSGRTVELNVGFSGVDRGASREGLWCAAGATGTVSASNLIPATDDFSISFAVGFPSALTAGQRIFGNSQIAIAVDANGRPSVALADGTAAVSEVGISDGGWHHVCVIRRSGGLEVWVDAVKTAESAASGCTTHDDSGVWTVLDGANNSAVFLDELRIYTAALEIGDVVLLKSLAASQNTPTDPTAVDHSVAAALGQIIDFADGKNDGWGVPVLVSDGDDLIAAADVGTGFAPDNQSFLWRSTDAGATWTRIAGIGLGAVSVFKVDGEPAGKLRMAGIDPSRGIPWTYATEDGCATWSVGRRQKTTGLAKPWYPSVPVLALGAYNLMTPQGVYSMNLDSSSKGALGPAKANSDTAVARDAATGQGGFVMTFGGKVFGQWPKAAETSSGSTNRLSCALLASLDTAGDYVQYRGSVNIRGGSGPFGVAWDPVLRRYWGVTAYSSGSQGSATNRLALYACEKDAACWIHCGDVLDAGVGVSLATPNVAISGDDLIVAFAANVVAGGRTGRYLLSRKIVGFRSRDPGLTYRKAVLVVDTTADRVLSMRENPLTGEFEPGGYFAEELGAPADLKFENGCVWLLKGRALHCYSALGVPTGRVFDYSSSAVVTTDPNCMGFSYDGQYAYLADAFRAKADCADNRVWRVDLKTGDVVLFASGGSSGMSSCLYRVRALVGLPDGTLAVANRDGSDSVFALNANGEVSRVLVSGMQTSVAPQAMCLDRKAGCLYVGGNGPRVLRYDLQSGAEVSKTVPKEFVFGMCCDDAGRIFSTSYDAAKTASAMLFDGKGDFPDSRFLSLLSGVRYYGRCCAVRMPGTSGFLLMLR